LQSVWANAAGGDAAKSAVYARWYGFDLARVIAAAPLDRALGVAGPSRDLLIKRATPKGATGRVYGTVYSGLDVGFALSPLVFGVLMDHGWYAATLAGGAVVLALSDDGVGFDPAQGGAGWGLIIMRERAESIGARFALEAAPGRGVRIAVRCPA